MAAKKISHLIILGIYFILFTLYQKENMFHMLDTSSQISTYSSLFLFVIALFYILFNYKYPVYIDSTFKSFCAFEVVILVISLFYSLFSPLSYNLMYFIIFIPLLSALFVRSVIINIDNERFILFVFLAFLIISLFYMQNHYVEILKDEDNVTNASYTILYLLPLLLCASNKFISILSVCIAVVIVIMSFKRGSISALSIGLLIYFYINNFKLNVKRSKLSSLIILSLGIGVFYECLIYFNEISDNTIFDRFQSIEEDRGSGRLDVFKHTVDMILSSNFLEILFGHGWNQVVVNSNLGLSAHNDHLEIIYDFGILAYMMFLFMYVKLVQFNISLVKIESNLAAPMAMSLVIFFIGSLISHIVIYPYYMTIFAITWTYMIMTTYKQSIKFHS